MYECLHRNSDISILQLPFPVYPTHQSSGCSFALWNSTAETQTAITTARLAASSPHHHLQTGTHRASGHCCPSSLTWMWKRVLQPPKTNIRKTHWNKCKAFGGVKCVLCCRAPRGCGCSSNTQGLTDTGCRQAQLLFRLPSPIRMHLNSSPYHLSSLTSSAGESRAP